MKGVTVYAFVRAPVKAPLGKGARREKLEVMAHGRVAAIVGAAEVKPSPDEKQLRAHDRVVMRLHEALDGVLPVRFGTCEPRSSVLAALETRETSLREALRRVKGAVQMNVRLIAAQGERAATGVAGERTLRADSVASRRVPPLSSPLQESTAWTSRSSVEAEPLGPGAAYLQARFHADRARRTAPELEPIRAELDGLVRMEKVRRDESASGVIGAVYHLVPRGRLARYQKLLAQSQATLGVKLVVTGPYAPYAFGPESAG